MYLRDDIPHPTCFRDLDPVNIIGHGEYSYYVTNVLNATGPFITTANTSDYF